MPLALKPELFRRYDETADERFYQTPRFVTHIDEDAIAAVTQLYREYFPTNGVILDLMSSWVSHLPPEIDYAKVVGLGMNGAELAENPRLNGYVVQSLNANPILPFADATFDGCGICVSIQYLTDPITVLREVGRVLKPNAPLVITFSNRCFPTKAVAIWQMLSDKEHLELVAHYLSEVGNYTGIEMRDCSPKNGGDPLFAVVARCA